MQLSCLFFLLKTGKKLCNYGKCQKTEFWRTLGIFMTKIVFAQTILDKIFGTKQRKV